VEAIPKTLKFYETDDDKAPFRDWLNDYDGQKVFGIILARLKKVEKGLMGDCEPVGSGVHELKIDFGPGFRLYFGCDGTDVVLLWGGIKRTQPQDIKTAIKFWEDYNA